MNELNDEQKEFLNAKFVIADLTLQLYQVRAENHNLRVENDRMQKWLQEEKEAAKPAVKEIKK